MSNGFLDLSDMYIDTYNKDNVANKIAEFYKTIDNADTLSIDISEGIEGIREIISSIWETIKKFFKVIIDALKKMWSWFVDIIKQLIAKAKALFKRVFHTNKVNNTVLSAIILFNNEFKDKAEEFIELLSNELKKYEVVDYVEDSKLNNVAIAYKQLSEVFNIIISNPRVFVEYVKYVDAYEDTFGYIKNHYNGKVSNIIINIDLYNYVIANTQHYGETKSIYDIVLKLVPELFDSSSIMKDTEELYNNVLNKFQSRADFIAGIINSIEKNVHDDLAYFSAIKDNKIKQIEKINTLLGMPINSKKPSNIYIMSLLTYLKRIVNIVTNSISGFTKYFNIFIDTFARYLGETGITNKANEVNINSKIVTEVLFKNVRPIANFDGINIYNAKDIQYELERMVGIKTVKQISVERGNAVCILLQNVVQPIIIVSDFTATNIRQENKNVFKYTCYHEIGHYANGDVSRGSNVSLMYYLYGKFNPELRKYRLEIDKGIAKPLRTLEHEIKADLYIVDRRIFTPRELLTTMVASYTIDANAEKNTLKNYLDRCADAWERLKYMLEWIENGIELDFNIRINDGDKDSILERIKKYK